jgi:outer membrane murein-binding lipoprotein Lpp
METSLPIRERIMAAADALYEESSRRNIPTVDAVRKLAKVNINDASSCMREWRRVNATSADTPPLQVPDTLQQTCIKALQALWSEAVSLSGETLRMAQAGWDAERTDAKILSEQVESACAALDEDLRMAKIELETITLENARLNESLIANQSRVDAAERCMIELRTAASQSEARSVEIGKRADDLRQALELAHATHATTSREQAASSRAQSDEIATLRRELEAAREKLEKRAADGQSELLAAIEDAARLRGTLDAVLRANGSIPSETAPPKIETRDKPSATASR